MEIIQLLFKDCHAPNCHRMIAGLPNSILTVFLVVKNLDPKEPAELAQFSQIRFDFGSRVPLEITDNIRNLLGLLVANDGVEVVGHNDIAVNIQPFVGLTIFETIQQDLKNRFIEQNGNPEVGAGSNKVDRCLVGDFVS